MFAKFHQFLAEVLPSGYKLSSLFCRLSLLINRLNQEDYMGGVDIQEKRDQPRNFDVESSLLEAPSERSTFMDRNPPPCYCYSNSRKDHDFGPRTYPRYLSEVSCNATLCGSSLYRCHPLKHTIHIFKRIDSLEGTVDDRSIVLHRPLCSEWRTEAINITVACVCQRNYCRG
jgi:hypothetical protein